MTKQKRGKANPPKGGQALLKKFIKNRHRNMIAKKQTDYIGECYLCATACSKSSNSKAVWVTETIVASVCLGCFDRTNGWTKEDEKLPDPKRIDLFGSELLFGAGLVGQAVWDKEKKSMIYSSTY